MRSLRSTASFVHPHAQEGLWPGSPLATSDRWPLPEKEYFGDSPSEPQTALQVSQEDAKCQLADNSNKKSALKLIKLTHMTYLYLPGPGVCCPVL
jgi:hypothetical protein